MPLIFTDGNARADLRNEPITRRLVIYQYGDEMRYHYLPDEPIRFPKDSTEQTLKIILVTDEFHPPSGSASRYGISHFTTSKVNKLKTVRYKNASGMQDHADGDEKSALPQRSSEVDFVFKLENQESVYLTVVASDAKFGDHRLICCDPQVQHGTGTGP